jgi:hypothetical protein
MAGDNNVFLIKIQCETCGRFFYYLESLRASGIRVRFGLHEFSCRRARFPLKSGSEMEPETDVAERDRR